MFSGTSQSDTARDAAFYLAHTEQGAGIRAIAQAVGIHPSTVLRAVRRVEQKRDDPL
ncbi:MAG: helix-turn-helix domain-containing protein, partial [Pseudomonadota bacterium]